MPSLKLGRRARASAIVGVLLTADALLAPPGPLNTAPGDIGLVLVILLAWRLPKSSFWITHGSFRNLMTGSVWLVAVGTVLSLTGPGLTDWAVKALVQDVYLLALGLAIIRIGSKGRYSTRWLVRPHLMGLLLMTVFAVQQGHAKLGGLYPHPNKVGAYLATAGVLLLATSAGFRGRALVVTLVGIGLFQAASFGALVGAGVGAGYLLITSLGRSDRRRLAAATILGVVAAVTLFPGTVDYVGSRVGDSPELSAQRFDRSRSGRLDLWSDALDTYREHPLGIGPTGTVNRNFSEQELHSDYLAYLVERSPIALLGLALGAWAVWRFGRRGGPVRAVLLTLMVQGVFREVLHFRVTWVVLALAIVYEHVRDPALVALRARARERSARDVRGRPAVESPR